MGQKTIGARSKAALLGLQIKCRQKIKNAVQQDHKYEFCEAYCKSEYIADPELFNLGKWVENTKNDLIYLELFVFEVRFVRYVLEMLFEVGFLKEFQAYNHKPVDWSKINNKIGSIMKSSVSGFSTHPISRAADDLEKFRNIFRVPIKVFEKIISSIEKSQPDKVEPDYLKTLYFRGCLEAAMWFPEKNGGRQFDLPMKIFDDSKSGKTLSGFDLRKSEGFYKNASLGFSREVFENYRQDYRRIPLEKRKSDIDYFPKKGTPHRDAYDPSSCGVFVDPVIWKNYHKTDSDKYRQPGKSIQEDPTPADKETILDWKELWAINGRDKRFRPMSAIINYLSWQLFLQSREEGRNFIEPSSDSGSEIESYLATKLNNY